MKYVTINDEYHQGMCCYSLLCFCPAGYSQSIRRSDYFKMLPLALLIVAVLCAVQALRTARLLVAAIWLAGVSALVALLLYLIGAPEVAVIELSVGAGLVTVLFVFAISMAGEDITPLKSLIPGPLALALVGVAVIALIWLALPLVEHQPSGEAAFGAVLWQNRGADVLVQLVLIFSGVLGMLGLLADDSRPATADVEPADTEAGTPSNVDALTPEPEKELV